MRRALSCNTYLVSGEDLLGVLQAIRSWEALNRKSPIVYCFGKFKEKGTNNVIEFTEPNKCTVGKESIFIDSKLFVPYCSHSFIISEKEVRNG